VVKDEPEELRKAINDAADLGNIRIVLTNGGTGITARDTTHETLTGMFEKRLDGFGEIFRVLSFHEIGAAAMLSRAVAGTYRGMIVMSMPGSTNAVKLAMDKLILPELSHLVREISK
jgi:molybdenum cofactor biosynthesis protein B